MLSIFHWLLLQLPPELAHNLGILALRIYQPLLRLIGKNVPPRGHLRPPFSSPFSSPPFAIEGMGNRVGLAAGFDKNAEAFLGLSGMGFGFIEVGTVTPLPQEGNPKPRLWRVPSGGLINQMGFNNCGVIQFKKNLRKNRPYCAIPILANIGKNKDTPNERALDDYDILFKELSAEVDGFVVNLSSPNTEGLRDLQTVAFLEKLELIAPKKPIWIKLAPDLETQFLTELFIKIKNSPVFSGCVLTNTSKAIALNDYGKTEGGYSGEKLFQRSLQCVRLCREIFQSKKTIIAVGGIHSLAGAQQMRDAGADLIEVYTGFVYHGPQLIKDLQEALPMIRG